MKYQTSAATLRRRGSIGLVVLSLLAWGLSPTAAQITSNAPGSLDLTFDPTAGGELVGLTGGSPIVHSVQTQPDGKVLVGGAFNGVNGVSRNNIARLHADGSTDLSFHPGLGTDGEVKGLALQPDGKVVLIGAFNAVDTRPHRLIARLNADGTVDQTFNCQITGDTHVRLDGVAVQSSGQIWVGGRFTNVNGVTRLNLARLNQDGTLDATFDLQGLVPGTSIAIHRIRNQPDGKLLVSGSWVDPQRSLIRLNADGSRDESLIPVVALPIGFYDYIYDTFTHTDGTIAIVGSFESVNGVLRRYAARLLSNGVVDPDFNADLGRRATAAGSVVVQPDGKFIIGGWFTEASGAQRLGIARLNIDGTVDTSFDSTNVIGRPPATAYQPGVQSLALQTNGHVVVGASAWWLRDNTNSVFSVDLEGRRDPDFNTLVQAAPGGVVNMALQPDGKVIVGVPSGFGWPRLIRLSPNGLLDESFHPETNLLWLDALTVQPDGKILVNHSGAQSLLRLHPDGDADTTFEPPPISAFDQGIETVVVQPDGKLLIGGLLLGVDGRPYPGIARLHADGRLDTNFHPVPISVGDDVGNGVEHILLLPGGKIFIGGGFTWGSESYSPAGLALLHADGTLDTNFLANIPAPGFVSAAALQSDGKILLSGVFAEGGGNFRSDFVRLNADGTQDTTFRPAVSTEFSALAVQPDGQILALRGWETNSLIRLYPDGSLDSTFQGPNLLGAGRLILRPDGRILVSGSFHNVNGIPRHGIAQLNNDVRWRLQVASPTQPGEFRFMISGRPEARLIIEGSSDMTLWTPLGELTTGTAPAFFIDSAATGFDRRFYRAREATTNP